MPHSNIAIFVPHLGCPNQCSFCNQNSITGEQKSPTPTEVKKICEQALCEIKNPNDAEIAFFGGSFTMIEHEYMLSLLECVQEFIGVGKFKGIRISTRPDGIDNEILKNLKKYNVTSIELGVQSMSDKVLSANDRGHSAEDVRKAAELIKSNGFELGLQMIIGLYKSNPQTDIFSAKEIIKLHPQTVRIYPAVVLAGTKLERLFKSGEYIPYEMDAAVQLCAKLILEFEDNKIKIIKLGLHASETVEGEMLGGIYHPAFKELCENFIFLERIKENLINKNQGNYKIFVSENSISKAVGQKRANIISLENNGYNIKIVGSKELAGYAIRIVEEENRCT